MAFQSFNLNLPPQNHANECLFDLNRSPAREDVSLGLHNGSIISFHEEFEDIPRTTSCNFTCLIIYFSLTLKVNNSLPFGMLIWFNVVVLIFLIGESFENTTIEVETHQEAIFVLKKEMTDQERWEIYHALLQRSINGKLSKTTTKEVSILFSIPLQTVQRIWRRAKNTPSGERVDVSHKRKGKCVLKKTPVDLDRIFDIPLRQRGTLRSLAPLWE